MPCRRVNEGKVVCALTLASEGKFVCRPLLPLLSITDARRTNGSDGEKEGHVRRKRVPFLLVRNRGLQSGGGTIVSGRPCQIAVLCLEVAHTAYLNRIEK